MHLKEKYYGRNAASDTASVQKHFWGTLLQVTFPEWVNFMNTTTITFEQNSDLGPAADARLDGGARLHPPGPRQGQPLPQLHRLVLIRRFCQVWEVDPLSSQCTCGEGSCSPRQVYILVNSCVPQQKLNLNTHLLRYWKYLSDRSYIAPMAFDTSNPLFTTTVPAFFCGSAVIILFMGTLSFCHWLAYVKDHDKMLKINA